MVNLFTPTLLYATSLVTTLTLRILAPFIYIGLSHIFHPFKNTCLVFAAISIYKQLSHWVYKTWIYTTFISEGRLFSSWSRASIVVLLFYFLVNCLCIIFPISSLNEASIRAANLALINMVLLYAGPCFSFLADILHIPLRSYERLHSCAGLLVWLLGIFHTIVLFCTKGMPLLDNNENKWALIVSIINNFFLPFIV